MQTTIRYTNYSAAVGPLTLACTGSRLCGIYNENQKHWPKDFKNWHQDNGSIFDATRNWLDRYFSRDFEGDLPELVFDRGTDFQKRVWATLLDIKPGETITYGQLAFKLGLPSAARAVGAAVGRNPISILVPCHRVVGKSGRLTGYAGGLHKKQWLIAHEANR